MKVTQMMVYADLMSYMPPTALKFADLDKAVSFEYSSFPPWAPLNCALYAPDRESGEPNFERPHRYDKVSDDFRGYLCTR